MNNNIQENNTNNEQNKIIQPSNTNVPNHPPNQYLQTQVQYNAINKNNQIESNNQNLQQFQTPNNMQINNNYPQNTTQTIQNSQIVQQNNNMKITDIPQGKIVNNNIQNQNPVPSNKIQLNNNKSINNQILPKKETENSSNNQIRKLFIILIFIGLIITITAIGLLIYDNYQYKNYTITSADLVDYEKVENKGIIYYQGNYKYKIKRKEYFYTQKELSPTTPEKVIQLKYNPTNPNKVYEKTISKYLFIMLFSGIGLSFISGIIAIALTTSNLKEIITVEVVEQVNCVGGKRIYLNNISIKEDSEEAKTIKYYIYFTKDYKKFALGNKLNFNIYQYGEAFTTEKYKNIIGRAIYNFKDEDFTLIEENNNKTITNIAPTNTI